ncbi:MAG: VTT domain-containing protein [Myxococcales bacterium]|nr:VTT domain-containing protein [Myxococcales bacterium]
MQSVLDALDGFGGIYVALFLFAILSGVFPLANSEAALIALGAASPYAWPKLVVLAVLVALGQSVTHAIVFQSGRGLAKVGAKGHPKLEARLAKARELGARWQKSELLLITLGATIGIPPQVLVALLAGVIGIRFRTFVAIDVAGRIARFTTIVLIAHLV